MESVLSQPFFVRTYDTLTVTFTYDFRMHIKCLVGQAIPRVSVSWLTVAPVRAPPAETQTLG